MSLHFCLLNVACFHKSIFQSCKTSECYFLVYKSDGNIRKFGLKVTVTVSMFVNSDSGDGGNRAIFEDPCRALVTGTLGYNGAICLHMMHKPGAQNRQIINSVTHRTRPFNKPSRDEHRHFKAYGVYIFAWKVSMVLPSLYVNIQICSDLP